jgi:hypothetical protein
LGLLVIDVRGRRLGTVAAINHCCIQLDTGYCVAAPGIFAVTTSEVEIVCDADQLQRYACPLHTTARSAK